MQGTFPLFVSPGQSATFTVSLNTSSPSSYGGQFSMTTNDPNNANFSLNLSGAVSGGGGMGGNLQLYDGQTQLTSGSSDTFATVPAGTTDSKTFTITDNASGSLTVNSLTLPSGFIPPRRSPSTSIPMARPRSP